MSYVFKYARLIVVGMAIIVLLLLILSPGLDIYRMSDFQSQGMIHQSVSGKTLLFGSSDASEFWDIAGVRGKTKATWPAMFAFIQCIVILTTLIPCVIILKLPFDFLDIPKAIIGAAHKPVEVLIGLATVLHGFTMFAQPGAFLNELGSYYRMNADLMVGYVFALILSILMGLLLILRVAFAFKYDLDD